MIPFPRTSGALDDPATRAALHKYARLNRRLAGLAAALMLAGDGVLASLAALGLGGIFIVAPFLAVNLAGAVLLVAGLTGLGWAHRTEDVLATHRWRRYGCAVAVIDRTERILLFLRDPASGAQYLLQGRAGGVRFRRWGDVGAAECWFAGDPAIGGVAAETIGKGMIMMSGHRSDLERRRQVRRMSRLALAGLGGPERQRFRGATRDTWSPAYRRGFDLDALARDGRTVPAPAR